MASGGASRVELRATSPADRKMSDAASAPLRQPVERGVEQRRHAAVAVPGLVLLIGLRAHGAFPRGAGSARLRLERPQDPFNRRAACSLRAPKPLKRARMRVWRNW